MSNYIRQAGIGAMVISAGLAVIFAVGLFFMWITPDAMTNEQIITETKRCEDAGLEANQVMNGFTYDVTKVICGESKK